MAATADENNRRTWRVENLIGILFLAMGMAFSLWALLPEFAIPNLHFSDSAFHVSILKALDEAWRGGRNPLDFWYDKTPFGFALFRSYQYIPYVIMYAAHLLMGEVFSLDQILQGSTIICAALFPLSIFLTARLLGLATLEAGCAAIASVLVIEREGYGISLQNVAYGRAGLITQIWAMVFVGPAIAASYRYFQTGTFLGLAVLSSFMTFGSHVVSAFIVFFGAGVFFLSALVNRYRFRPEELRTILIRGGTLFGLVVLVTAHQWLFVLFDAPYINQSIIEPSWKYASRGVLWTAKAFWLGELLDMTRFPGLTLALIIGTVGLLTEHSLIKKQDGTAIKDLCFSLPFLLLLFLSLLAGWEIWGWLFSKLPVLRSLHMHRFIVGAQICGVLLAGIGFALIIRYGLGRVSTTIISLLTVALLLRPAVLERVGFFSNVASWKQSTDQILKKNGEIEKALSLIRSKPQQWVYSGSIQTWQPQILQAGYLPPHYFVLAAGLKSVGGMLYHAFSLAGDTMFQFAPERLAHYALFGVSTVIAPADWKAPEFLNKDATFGQLGIWSRQVSRFSSGELGFTVCGDFRKSPGFMQSWVRSYGDDSVPFGEIRPGNCDQAESSIKQISFSELPPFSTPTAPSPGEIKNEKSEGAWKASADIMTDHTSLVVLNTGFHPNWRALLDDQPVKTLWVTPGFVAIEVPSGTHRISFEYFGSRLKTVLFGCSLLLLALLLGAAAVTKKATRTSI